MGQGLEKFIFGPAIKATAYGVEAALKTAARAVGDLGEAAAASAANPVMSVRIWFKAFIPQAELRLPPYDCFLGDNRSFSSDRDASARMQSEVLLQDLNTANPRMTESHRCGLTRRVDCNSGELIDSGTSATDGMRFHNFRFPGAEVYNWSEPHPPAANPGTIIVPATAPVSIDYRGIAADPLVPIAPQIDLDAHIELDQSTGVLTVTGWADEYPAFEGYLLVNEHYGPITLFTLDGDDRLLAIVGAARRRFSRAMNLRSEVAQG